MKLALPDKMPASRNPQLGMTLVELMIAMLVLAVGLGGITTLLITAISTNNRNSRDTTATMLAQLVIEEIGSQDPNSGVINIPITDCAGNAFDMNVTGGAAPGGAGATLVTNAASVSYGGIDHDPGACGHPSRLPYELCRLFGGRWYPHNLRRPLECNDDQREQLAAHHSFRAPAKCHFAWRT